MMKIRNKGMIDGQGVLQILILIVIIGYVLQLGLQLTAAAGEGAQSRLASMTNSDDALAVSNNISENINDSYDQAADLPQIYVMILMILAILSILRYLNYV